MSKKEGLKPSTHDINCIQNKFKDYRGMNNQEQKQEQGSPFQ